MIAIDVGVKNLGLCIYDVVNKRICVWERISLFSGSYVPQNNVEYCRNLVAKYQGYFDNAERVLIEKQIRSNMRIIEAIFHTMFYDTTWVIHAKVVKQHFNLCCNNYKLNKMAAINYVGFNGDTRFANWMEFYHAWTKEPKKDDMADSMLLVMYYLDVLNSKSQCSSNVEASS